MLTYRQWQKLFKNPFFILGIIITAFIVGEFTIRYFNYLEENPIKSRVWQTVQEMNRCWTVDRDPQALQNYFHPNMVVITPGDSLSSTGRDTYLAGWPARLGHSGGQAFVETNHIISWKEIDPQVQIYGRGRSAIVTYYWEIEYEHAGQVMHSTGRDMFALVREHGRWWIVADQFSAFPNKN